MIKIPEVEYGLTEEQALELTRSLNSIPYDLAVDENGNLLGLYNGDMDYQPMGISLCGLGAKPEGSNEVDLSGYPTEETLLEIQNWRMEDSFDKLIRICAELFNAHIGSARQQDDGSWVFATGGWSGCSEIISAMQRNYLFWALYWESSHRGGKYIFQS